MKFNNARRSGVSQVDVQEVKIMPNMVLDTCDRSMGVRGKRGASPVTAPLTNRLSGVGAGAEVEVEAEVEAEKGAEEEEEALVPGIFLEGEAGELLGDWKDAEVASEEFAPLIFGVQQHPSKYETNKGIPTMFRTFWGSS